MQLERLVLDLRPRPHPQALDLGMALLRAHAWDAYRAWLALWLPLAGLALAATWYAPQYGAWFFTAAWWLRPLIERAPLYVLSREVFGEHVNWRAALRAWPRELGGGWFRMLTWWRPFMSGRGLYQPVWQLERARRGAASQRLRTLARQGTGFAAWAFGTACAMFEMVLAFGVLGLVSLFVTSEQSANPFAVFAAGLNPQHAAALALLTWSAYAIGVAVIGPVYVACTFALYLNRRANLEAWDIELTLRQIRAPASVRAGTPVLAPAPLAALLGGMLCAFALWLPAPAVQAAEEVLRCAPPAYVTGEKIDRAPAADDRQRKVRADVDAIFAGADLRGYECQQVWRLRNPGKTEVVKTRGPLKLPEWAALTVEATLIGAALLLAGWFLYRYRNRFSWSRGENAPLAATEVAGLDITAASLPDDVPAHARALWARGERRAALALLYRATLSRLVYQQGLDVHAGATEGDCLRLARAAHAAERLDAHRLGVATGLTSLWLAAAYGDRWPDGAAFERQCAAWEAIFDGVAA